MSYIFRNKNSKGIPAFWEQVILIGSILLLVVLLSYYPVGVVAASESFDDGFESGGFDAWSGVSSSTGETAAVSTSPILDGVYSAGFTSDGDASSETSYAYNTLDPQNELYVRGYVYVSQNGLADTSDRFWTMAVDAGSSVVAFTGWYETSSGLRWFLVTRDGISTVIEFSDSAPVVDRWYCVELHWVNDAVDGLGELWVNGVLVCSIDGTDTSTFGDVSRLRVGLPLVGGCDATSVYVDCVEVSGNYIGPIITPTVDEWVTVYDKEYPTGSSSSTHYGLTPAIRSKYIIDLDWEDYSGLYLGVGGVKLRCYSQSSGISYIAGIYSDASGTVNTAFIWNLGQSGRVSITIDTDTTLGKAVISAKGNTAELQYYYPLWFEDQSSNIFSPYTVSVAPVSGAEVNIYRVSQKVNAPTSVTAIGSTKYQAFGYDCPRARSTVEAGMNEIRNANMEATIFADVGYIDNPSYLQYLNGLVDDGWEVGIHFTVWGLDDMNWAYAQTEMIDQYTTISNAYGTPPLSFCLLGIGHFSDPLKTQWVVNNFDMFQRGWRAIPQSIGGSHDLLDLNINYWMGAANAGVATLPAYVHETEVTPADSSSISAGLFDAWLASIIDNGVKLTGYQNWYMINSNQLDANFYTSTDGSDTTITAHTNGYNAIILVKIDADTVTSVKHDNQNVEYSTSPDGYIVFEVEDGESYVVSTGTTPNPTDTIIVDSTIVITDDFDGGGDTYIRGPALGDYPIFRVEGTGNTLQNVVIDDGNFIGLGAAVVLSGTANSIKYCTLNNCIRYGFSVSSASDFYYGYNTVNKAQYGFSGSSGSSSSGWGVNGIIEYNTIRGIRNCGVKCKAFRNVIIRNNFMDLTPRANSPSVVGVEISNDAPNIDVTIENNLIIRVSDGGYPNTGAFGFHTDPPPNIANPEIISTGIIFRDNQATNCLWGAYLNGDNTQVTWNTFTNSLYGIINNGENNIVSSNTFYTGGGTTDPPEVSQTKIWLIPDGVRLDPEGDISIGNTARVIALMNDPDTNIEDLNVEIYLRPSGGNWFLVPSPVCRCDKGWWYVDWVVPGGAVAGLYDVRVVVDDGSNPPIYYHEYGEFNVVSIPNDPPEVSQTKIWIKPDGVRIDPRGAITIGKTAKILAYMADPDTLLEDLTVKFYIRPQGASWFLVPSPVSNPSKGNWYAEWVVPGDAVAGLYDVSVLVDDGSNPPLYYNEYGEFNVRDYEVDRINEVTYVFNGDVFKIWDWNSTLGRYELVNMADMDAPGTGETGYQGAKDRLTELVYGETVYLDTDQKSGRDQYDRLVSVVYLVYNSTHYLNVNKLMLDEGYVSLNDSTDNEFDPDQWQTYERYTYPT